MTDWTRYRYQTDDGGAVDLYRATEDTLGISGELEEIAHAHFRRIETMQPIFSRQAAAIAIGDWATIAELALEVKRLQDEVEKMQAQPAVAS